MSEIDKTGWRIGKEGFAAVEIVGLDPVAKTVPDSRSRMRPSRAQHRRKGIVGRENGICKCVSATISSRFCQDLNEVSLHEREVSGRSLMCKGRGGGRSRGA